LAAPDSFPSGLGKNVVLVDVGSLRLLSLLALITVFAFRGLLDGNLDCNGFSHLQNLGSARGAAVKRGAAVDLLVMDCFKQRAIE
jgi:hypothetical protein